MNRLRAAKILTALIIGVSAPTVASLGYFLITGDPTFRPLGLSKLALDTFQQERASMDILADIRWGNAARLSDSQDQVRAIISQKLESYDVDYRVQINPTEGTEITITYVVMGSRIGPYPITQAGRGLGAAVTALRLNIRAAEQQASNR